MLSLDRFSACNRWPAAGPWLPAVFGPPRPRLGGCAGRASGGDVFVPLRLDFTLRGILGTVLPAPGLNKYLQDHTVWRRG